MSISANEPSTVPSLASLLDQVVDMLMHGDGKKAVAHLCGQLNQIRGAVGEGVFETQIIPACRRHRLFEIVQQDPYSQRAWEKPRGYAGDAVMLDYVYSGQPPDGVTTLGRVVFEGTTRSSNGQSVVNRRNYLAQLLDQASGQHPSMKALSLACGHLREADVSRSLQTGAIESLAAIDQDAKSLQVVKEDYPFSAITTFHGSVVDLLRGRLNLPEVHFAYSLGLFDYLNDRLASKTIAALSRLLLPAGKLVVSNFTNRSHGRSFMDAFMDWRLAYRSEAQLLALCPKTAELVPRVVRDALGNIAYLEVTKASQ